MYNPDGNTFSITQKRVCTAQTGRKPIAQAETAQAQTGMVLAQAERVLACAGMGRKSLAQAGTKEEEKKRKNSEREEGARRKER